MLIPKVLANHIPDGTSGVSEPIAKLPDPASHLFVTLAFVIIAGILLGLFIFWRRKKAKMMYQAWALFAFVMYSTIYLNHMLPSRILTGNQVTFIFLILFINSTVTIFRSWRDSEKYLPKTKIEKMKKTERKPDIMKKIAITKFHAFWFTIKNGGNDEHNKERVKRELSQRHLKYV